MRKLIILALLFFVSCNIENDKPGLIHQQSEMADPKVCIIGFDGATWRSLDRALEMDLMPNLERLIQTGVHGPLHTIHPTITTVIWTSIATGKLPEKHGITNIIVQDVKTKTMKPISSTQVRVKPIWKILSDRKKSVEIIRWPVTWPAMEVNGVLVSEFAFQETRDRRCYPPAVCQLVDRFYPNYRLKDIETLTGIDRDTYRNLDPSWQWKLLVLLKEYNLDILFRDVAKELLKNEQKSFTTVYFYSMDTLGHNYFKFNEGFTEDLDTPDFSRIIPNWCWLYDQFLGEILGLLDPDTYVIICSDHGMDLALEPVNYLIRSENDPPQKDKNDSAPAVDPAPDYDADPMQIHMRYTLPTGQHVDAPDGIFVMKGPGIHQGQTLANINVCDIAPTVLYCLDQPVAMDFDGKPLLQAFEESHIKDHPLAFVETYETSDAQPADSLAPNNAYSKEDERLIDRLRAMGYVR
ncbi:alkaline phosphatase family protein [bacterium]|nr:alkaline phosphatase family protein [candidate division CSSED10-310 bacterium]